jgi:3'-phosphoadenosine 5'-phosphosulfate sulfotransferase (PAPS reductase)/FAD synthetase
VKYLVTRSCGHKTPITLFGAGRDRENKLEWLETQPCHHCKTDANHERALIQQDARDLPPLIGSDKQIEWAVRCRYHALRLVDRVIGDAEAKPMRIPLPDAVKFPGEDDPRLGDVLAKLYANDSARFWIDHGRYADVALSEHGRYRLLEREGVDATPGRLVALLLLAAAGVEHPDHKTEHRLWGQLGSRVDYAALRSVSLDGHIDTAMAAIKQALRGRSRPYVALSGGKDSAVVRHLVERVRSDVTLFWSDDELEFPESVELMERTMAEVGNRLMIAFGWAQHAGWFTPWMEMPFWRDPLYGTEIADMDADDWMAGRGHDVTFLGTRADESKVRAAWLEANGPVYEVTSGTGLRCCPIWDWPTDYVYQYAEREGIVLNAAYATMQAAGVELERRRVGPLPLVPGDTLARGWPDLYDRLVDRYGNRWRD